MITATFYILAPTVCAGANKLLTDTIYTYLLWTIKNFFWPCCTELNTINYIVLIQARQYIQENVYMHVSLITIANLFQIYSQGHYRKN